MEKPILFSGPMVRAILSGVKTQTRRVMKPQPCEGSCQLLLKPYRDSYGVGKRFNIGDILWVRETWRAMNNTWDEVKPSMLPNWTNVQYRATEWISYMNQGKWRPSIFMPRWASRISLKVTDVRAERIQDISHHETMAEGMDASYTIQPVVDFKDLWDSINKKRGFGWEKNPWVWAITFEVI